MSSHPRPSAAHAGLGSCLLLLSACGTTYVPACEDTPHPVSDDTELPTGFTVADIVAGIPSDLAVPGAWYDGRSAEVTITATRASGPVEWVESREILLEKRGGPPFSKSYLLLAVECDDHLRLPVELVLRTDDGELDIHEPVTARTSGMLISETADLRVELHDDSGQIEGMPLWDEHFDDRVSPEGEPLVPSAAFVYLSIDDTTVRGSAGWSGEATLRGSHMSWAESLIDFGTP